MNELESIMQKLRPLTDCSNGKPFDTDAGDILLRLESLKQPLQAMPSPVVQKCLKYFDARVDEFMTKNLGTIDYSVSGTAKYSIRNTCLLIDLLVKSKYLKDEKLENELERLFHSGFRSFRFLQEEKCASIDELIEVASLNLPSNYLLIKKLGKGRVGDVYLARNKYAGEVALKIVDKDIPSETVVRSIAELRKLNHPNIVTYYDPFEMNGKLVLPMEPFNQTLKERLGNPSKAIPLLEAIKYFEQMTSALAACHAEKNPIIHYDLAPHNVGLDGNGVKLTDFNHAIYDGTDVWKHWPIDYASPRLIEMSNQKAPYIVEPRDNVWSLGVVLYEMLTGKKIFSPINIDRNEKEDYVQGMSGLRSQLQDGLKLKTELDSVSVDNWPGAKELLPYFSDMEEASHLWHSISDSRAKTGLRRVFLQLFETIFLDKSTSVPDAASLQRQYQQLLQNEGSVMLSEANQAYNESRK